MRLEEEQSLKALHTYGTTGLMVEVEMRLAPRVDYDQLILSSPSWDALLDWTDAAARRIEWQAPRHPVRVANAVLLQAPGEIPASRRLDLLPPHRPFPALDGAIADAAAAGIECVYRKPLTDPPLPPFSTRTILGTTRAALGDQARTPPSPTSNRGFGRNFREQFAELRRRFPGEILFHLEWDGGKREDDAGERRRQATRMRSSAAASRWSSSSPRSASTRSSDAVTRSASSLVEPAYLLSGGGRPPPQHRRQAGLQGRGGSRRAPEPGQDEDLPGQPVRQAGRCSMSQDAAQPIVELADVEKRYGDGPLILDKVGFTAERGDFHQRSSDPAAAASRRY